MSRDGFVEQGIITPKQQRKYMKEHNDDYYVCVSFGVGPIGYIGSVDNDIRLAVVPWMRNRGVGKFMLNEFMKIRPWAYAKVLLGNDASKRLFESCGFDMVHNNDMFYYYRKKR